MEFELTWLSEVAIVSCWSQDNITSEKSTTWILNQECNYSATSLLIFHYNENVGKNTWNGSFAWYNDPLLPFSAPIANQYPYNLGQMGNGTVFAQLVRTHNPYNQGQWGHYHLMWPNRKVQDHFSVKTQMKYCVTVYFTIFVFFCYITNLVKCSL